VVIDLQKRFFRPGDVLQPALDDAVEIINHVAEAFRAAGRLVIWVQDRENVDETDPGYALLDGLRPEKGDPRVSKIPSNAFLEPSFLGTLEGGAADFLVLCGYRAEQCVLATARGAADREIPLALLRGAVVSPDPEAVAFVERLFPLLSHEVAVALAGEPSRK
jgi:nicotinamidase-related amidase